MSWRKSTKVEMATIEELVQMMNTLQGQRHALYQVMSRLLAESQQFRNAGSPGLAETATAVGQAVRTAMADANTHSNLRQNLVDIKGLGKLQMFREESAKILRVAQEDHMVSDRCVPPQLFGQRLSGWTIEKAFVTNDALEQQHGSLNDETR